MSSEAQAVADSGEEAAVISQDGPAEGEGEGAPAQPAQQQQGRGGWQMVRSIVVQMVIFYFITSFFRGRQQAPATAPDGSTAAPGANLFASGQPMEFHVYITEWEEFEFARDAATPLWSETLVYGRWDDGPSRDGSRGTTLEVDVPESVQNNGSWYLHVLMVKEDYPLDPEEEEYSPQAIAHTSRLFNKYRKRRIHNTANLITGRAEVAPGSIKAPQGSKDVVADIISYYHPNLTINVVDDQTLWTRGSVPQPLDKYVRFDNETGGYFPVLYINDYWNLAQEYMPLNDTTPTFTLTLAFAPLTVFKFNLYAAMTRDNPWSSMMGSSDPSDEEQDTVKQTLMETSPYLLGLTVAVSILHSVFEFLAFKNDVQFWRTRKSLEGLSVRSVFFNVFQSFIVLLYIFDNETNTVVIISVFVGLCIELWKVTKVVSVKVDWENLVAGVLPRLTFTDRPSYTSSTREYDMLAFKYLGWALFPLFIGYGIYSLLYVEHKGWYSFVLSMCYGFLLTFGFITMTPQLFINYKLKSVAHLPWRMLTYKALNTFIDDMFAFVIKMPMMYRIGCFRDDIVFFIFLYQRWIYRVDPKRVNEFGTSGEDHSSDPHTQGGTAENSHDPPSASAPDSEVNGPSGELPEPKSLAEKKTD